MFIFERASMLCLVAIDAAYPALADMKTKWQRKER
jgi:hypothetical protein